MPLALLPAYDGQPAPALMRTAPPPAPTAPAWTAARQITESLVYMPAPQTEPSGTLAQLQVKSLSEALLGMESQVAGHSGASGAAAAAPPHLPSPLPAKKKLSACDPQPALCTPLTVVPW